MTESTFSLAQIWAQGDGVSHAVAIMLALMSLASWSVIFVKAWSLVQLRRMSGGAKQFWHATSFEAGMAALTPHAADNPFHDLAHRGTEAVSHHTTHRDELHGVLGLNDWLTSTLRQSIDDTTGRLQSGLSILASVGSTAPFIGLFGTVVTGLLMAFPHEFIAAIAGLALLSTIASSLVTALDVARRQFGVARQHLLDDAHRACSTHCSRARSCAVLVPQAA